MARSRQSVNVQVRGAFTIYDSTNTPVTGLAAGSFTPLVAKDGADSAVIPTIAEIGSGRYGYRFTPNATGYWHVLIRHATYNPRGCQDEFDVS